MGIESFSKTVNGELRNICLVADWIDLNILLTGSPEAEPKHLF